LDDVLAPDGGEGWGAGGFGGALATGFAVTEALVPIGVALPLPAFAAGTSTRVDATAAGSGATAVLLIASGGGAAMVVGEGVMTGSGRTGTAGAALDGESSAAERSCPAGAGLQANRTSSRMARTSTTPSAALAKKMPQGASPPGLAVLCCDHEASVCAPPFDSGVVWSELDGAPAGLLGCEDDAVTAAIEDR
jgi:hypothetical protein